MLMKSTASKRPVDMKNPSMNDILKYEILSVNNNRFMSYKEKFDKIKELKAQISKSID